MHKKECKGLKKQELLSKKLKKTNEKAFEDFDVYKKSVKIIEETKRSMWKKATYISTTNSTLNYKITINGYSSTQNF